MNISQFFQSAFSVDNVIFGFDEGDLKILLVKRGEEPFNNMWALPGEMVYPHENLDDAASRVLQQLTGLTEVYLEQVQTFGAPHRHPVGRVITIAYFSLIKIDQFELMPSLWAKSAKWHSISNVAPLAFDHNEILEASIQKLKRRVRVQPIGFELLPPKFTLTELQHLYEAILQTNQKKGIDKRNFRKKILAMDILVDCNENQEGVAHRPAKLYTFDKVRYESFVESGFAFEI